MPGNSFLSILGAMNSVNPDADRSPRRGSRSHGSKADGRRYADMSLVDAGSNADAGANH